MSEYNIPINIKELFNNREATYSIIDYEHCGMDNICSLNFFLDCIEVKDENIEYQCTTEAILIHPDFDYKIQINSFGLGDFHSHGFNVTVIN